MKIRMIFFGVFGVLFYVLFSSSIGIFLFLLLECIVENFNVGWEYLVDNFMDVVELVDKIVWQVVDLFYSWN